MDGEKVKGRIDAEGRMEEIMEGLPDSEAQKSKSSCLTRQSERVKMEERGSEIEYCRKSSKYPRGLIMQIAIISKDRLELYHVDLISPHGRRQGGASTRIRRQRLVDFFFRQTSRFLRSSAHSPVCRFALAVVWTIDDQSLQVPKPCQSILEV